MVRWGIDPNLPSGPPTLTLERWVVGASLLATVASMCLVISGRKRNPPSWRMRIIAAVCGLGVLAVALYVRSLALSSGYGVHWLGGSGWLWLVIGGAITTGATLGTMPLKGRRKPVKPRKRRRRK